MKKERMVGARLSAALVRDLEMIENAEQSDRSATLRKLLTRSIAQWKLDHFAGLYGESKMTLARAAREAGVSLWEMMDYVRLRRIPSQYDLEDLEHDLRILEVRSRPRKRA